MLFSVLNFQTTIIDTIQISIDGIGHVYNIIRKGTDFTILDKNIKLLSNSCKNTKTGLLLNMVVTKANFFQMPSMVKYAWESGIKYLNFTLINLASITDSELSDYDFIRTNEFTSIISEVDKIAALYKGVTVTNINIQNRDGFNKCPFPWNHFYICWNGFIVPCCAKPFPKECNFGNVNSHSIIDILNSKEFEVFRKLWYANRNPSFCQKCHFIEIEPIKKPSATRRR